MVLTGDTAISLHIRAPRNGWGGGRVAQTNSTESAKICPNLHLGAGEAELRGIQTNIPETLEWGTQ